MDGNELTINLRIKLALDGNGGLSVAGVALDGAGSQGGQVTSLPAAVAERVLANSPPSRLDLTTSFLERCMGDLGAQLAPPATGPRPYINIFPPAPYRRKRLGAVNPRSGRVHVELDPDLHERWADAKVVPETGDPRYISIYIESEGHIDQAIDMLRTVLRLRDE
jgi:hypothetical protein